MPFGKGNIESLYERYAAKLYHTSLRITADPMDAEEAMQDSFIKYHYYIGKGRIDNIEAWLTRVCVRTSIDIIRRRKADEVFLEDVSPAENRELSGLHDEEPAEAEFSVETIKEALLGLPDGYRLILSLHLFDGYDYTEISQMAGLKESTVRSQYARGRKKLLEALKNK